jgi:hypothetical protein
MTTDSSPETQLLKLHRYDLGGLFILMMLATYCIEASWMSGWTFHVRRKELLF